MLAYYLHRLDPFIVKFTENFGLRWYGLAYVLGFIAGFYVLRAFARRGYSELKPEQVGDFITWTALFGVMLGGRLGYMLLYDREHFFSNPLSFFRILDGGMASHGGILGVAVFLFFYARRHKISWCGLGDNISVVAPIGIFFGRIANFINGELYGRVAGNIPWAVQFPTELHSFQDAGQALTERVQSALPDFFPYPEAIIVAARTDPNVEAVLRELLNPRHPSQIYQALLEGLLLFLILLLIRLRFKILPHGLLTGLFFILYAFFRIGAEVFRVPDAALILGINPGQFYSIFMILVGSAFIAFALKKKRSAAGPS